MNANLFFDTNILIYSTVKNDRRHETATALLAAGGIVSIQVLNEFASVASRKLRWTWAEMAHDVTSFRTVCPNPSR